MIGIWEIIALGLKGLVHFIEKNSHINSDIYINQVLKEPRLPFYKQRIQEKSSIIWIDDGANYYTSKTTIEYCCDVGLIRIDWPTLSLDLNSIEN